MDAVKPFAKNLPGIITALKELMKFEGLTSSCKATIIGTLKYVQTYTCLVMATIWLKILIPVDNANKTIEARNATIDVEGDNLYDLR